MSIPGQVKDPTQAKYLSSCGLPSSWCRQIINSVKMALTNRIVQEWNKLPSAVVMAPSLDTFKSRLDKYWSTKNIFTFD
jgi:hypothetical protein